MNHLNFLHLRTLILFFFSIVFISSCKVIKDLPIVAVESVRDNSDNIASGLVQGLADGLDHPDTKLQLASVLEFLADELNYELSRLDLSNLEASVVGENLVIGLAEGLNEH